MHNCIQNWRVYNIYCCKLLIRANLYNDNTCKSFVSILISLRNIALSSNCNFDHLPNTRSGLSPLKREKKSPAKSSIKSRGGSPGSLSARAKQGRGIKRTLRAFLYYTLTSDIAGQRERRWNTSARVISRGGWANFNMNFCFRSDDGYRRGFPRWRSWQR